MKTVKGTKYEEVVMKVREVYTNHGSQLNSTFDFLALNESYKSSDGQVEFLFYYDGLSNIKTPEGMVSPLGSRSSGNEEAAHKELIELFGLELISDVKQNYERYITYKVTKHPGFIATTNSKPFDQRPDNKPSGMWKCVACGNVQHGSTLYRDPMSTGVRWTCSDLTCGGTCYSVENKISHAS